MLTKNLVSSFKGESKGKGEKGRREREHSPPIIAARVHIQAKTLPSPLSKGEGNWRGNVSRRCLWDRY